MSMNTPAVENASQTYATYSTKKTDRTEKTDTSSKTNSYGKTVGEPTLSDEAAKYYQELKKKYGNMDFILVSSDKKEQAKAQAGSYANSSKMVVLIDEDKVERMAADASYRKQYETIIANAASGLSQMKQSLQTTGANVKGYGMQVNDGGTATYFAVLEKSSAAQKHRIEKHAEEKQAQKKAEARKAQKEEARERLEKAGDDKDSIGDKFLEDADNQTGATDTVTITAGSLEELLQKINDYMLADKSNYVQTKEEKMVGQHVDFKG